MDLTNPGLQYQDDAVDPITGVPYSVMRQAFFKNPAARAQQFAKDATQAVQPQEAEVNGEIGPDSYSQQEAGGALTPDTSSPSVGFDSPQVGPMPKFFKPTISETSEDSLGLPKKINAGETKLGKLVHILSAAAKGATAGAEGGTFGEGMALADAAPYRDLARKTQAQSAVMGNQIQQMQARAFPLQLASQAAQLGNLRADTEWKKAHAAYMSAVKDVKDMPTMAQLHAAAAQKAIAAGRDPMADPETQAYMDQITGLQKASAPPKDTATTLKEHFMGHVQKLAGAGELPTNALTSSIALGKAISGSKTLTPEEKQEALSYLATNNTPASQGTLANIRLEGLGSTRGMNAYDTKTGKTVPVTWEEINRASVEEPGRYTSPQYTAEATLPVQVAKDVAVGKTRDQIVSVNTLLGHVSDLYNSILETKNTGVPWLNKPLNELRKDAAGDPQIADFIARIEPVRKEYETFLLNNHALQADDRAAANRVLDENMSPEQMLTNSKQIAHTSAIRLGSSNFSVKRNTGKDIPDLLTPDAQGILATYGIHVPGYSGSGGGGADVVVIKDSKGGTHRFKPEDWEKNKEKAMQRDPGLQVISQ